LVLAAVGGAFLGLFFSVMEHTLPLHRFRKAVMDLGDKKSSTDVMKPSTFRGVYKKIAAHINDALDKIAAQAGVDRGPADLEGVLGPLPAQPQMSAFSVPQAGEMMAPDETPAGSAPRTAPQPQGSVPKRRSLPRAKATSEDSIPDQPEPREPVDSELEDEPTRLQQRPVVSAALAAQAMGLPPQQTDDDADDGLDEETQWRKVYQDFVALKRKLGEPTQKLTYEKFRGTLQRNKDALMARHGCERVKFRVYEKQGRAALKASPVK
jgi:hypothetical protein